jgi:hypothetical protein
MWRTGFGRDCGYLKADCRTNASAWKEVKGVKQRVLRILHEGVTAWWWKAHYGKFRYS